MIQFASLNSGSNGNCYYVGNENEGVLIDAGISFKQIKLRMEHLGLSLKNIKALFISHEHRDHIMGVRMLTKKLQLPAYITKKTLSNARLDPYNPCWVPFHTLQPIEIGGMSITAFPKYHDAADPHSFIIDTGEKKIGVITDIGRACDQVKAHFSTCDAAILESNYDTEMLQSGPYPIYLKNRISGGEGHLSNEEALDLYKNHASSALQYLVLGHLSEDNNDPEKVSSLFSSHQSAAQIVVASRYTPSALMQVE